MVVATYGTAVRQYGGTAVRVTGGVWVLEFFSNFSERDIYHVIPTVVKAIKITRTRTRLGASSEQVVRDVDPQLGFRVFDKLTSES